MQSADQTTIPKKTSGLLYVAVVLTWRIAGMALLTFLLPLVASLSQALGHLDGQQQFGLSILAYAHGVLLAFIYLIAATAAHFLVWKRSIKVKCWVEAFILAVCILLLFITFD